MQKDLVSLESRMKVSCFLLSLSAATVTCKLSPKSQYLHQHASFEETEAAYLPSWLILMQMVPPSIFTGLLYLSMCFCFSLAWCCCLTLHVLKKTQETPVFGVLICQIILNLSRDGETGNSLVVRREAGPLIQPPSEITPTWTSKLDQLPWAFRHLSSLQQSPLLTCLTVTLLRMSAGGAFQRWLISTPHSLTCCSFTDLLPLPSPGKVDQRNIWPE